jgi:hypothetical protein
MSIRYRALIALLIPFVPAMVACGGDDSSSNNGSPGAGGQNTGGTTSTGGAAGSMQNQGGNAGVSAVGGASGVAGSSGNAGTGGNAQGGMSGNSGTAGTAGTSGNSGTGGTGGIGTPVFPDAHPRIYLNAKQQARLKTALSSNTKFASRYRNMVDQQLSSGGVYAFQGWHAAMMYALTKDAKYGNYAVNFVDQWVADEEMRIANGQNAEIAGDSYLEVGPQLTDLALTYDWCYDLLSTTQKERWIAYANQAVWNVWHNEQAKWGNTTFPWSGWSVDNPVNNYYFSFLKATMLVGLATKGENPDADGWLTKFRTEKIQNQLVPTYLSDLQGGGSREGTGYGVAMAGLFRLYDLWAETTTEKIANLTPHAEQSMAYALHQIVPTQDRIAPIGDHARDSTASLFDYHRDYLMILSSALYPNSPVAETARTLLDTCSVPQMSQGFMAFSDFWYDPTGLPKRPLAELYPAYYAPGTGHIFARSSWDKTATWMNVIAGPYSESHAHHDQGSLMIYRNEWLAYDANIDSHSGIQQGEELHNLVRIESGGSVITQQEGAPPSKLLALQDQAEFSFVALDSSPVYAGKGGIQKVEREVVFLKPGVFVVFDRVATMSLAAKRVFQLNVPIAPQVGNGKVTIQGTKEKLEMFNVIPSGVTPQVISWPSVDSDMEGGYRVDIAQSGSAETLFLTVLSTHGDVNSVVAKNGSGSHGVSLTLANGKTVEIQFTDSAVGGSLSIAGTGGNELTASLQAGIQTFPVMKLVSKLITWYLKKTCLKKLDTHVHVVQRRFSFGKRCFH